MAEARDEHGYPCNPRNITADMWFYEQHNGIVIVAKSDKPAIQNETISWRKLEATVDRHRRIKAKKDKGPC